MTKKKMEGITSGPIPGMKGDTILKLREETKERESSNRRHLEAMKEVEDMLEKSWKVLSDLR